MKRMKRKRIIFALLTVVVLGAVTAVQYRWWQQDRSVPTPEDGEYYLVNASCYERDAGKGERLGKIPLAPEDTEAVTQFLQSLKPTWEDGDNPAAVPFGQPDGIWLETGGGRYLVTLFSQDTSPNPRCLITQGEVEDARRWMCQAPDADAFRQMRQLIKDYPGAVQWYFEHGEYIEA